MKEIYEMKGQGHSARAYHMLGNDEEQLAISCPPGQEAMRETLDMERPVHRGGPG